MPLVSQPHGFTAYGIDGCPAGWFVVIVRPTGEREWRVVPAVDELVRAAADADRIFVDIPIGLPAGPKERVCDQVARLKLGRPRGSSVFRAPVREVLEAPSFAEAGKISREHTAIDGGEGKGVTKQTFAIVPKISEVDKLMRSCPKARGLVREIHPEVCFASLTGWRPMKHRKNTKAGFRERRAVLRMAWPHVDGLICDVLEKTLRKCVARDDILDAAVAALTACQEEEVLQTLPGKPSEDAYGLPMEMVCMPFKSSETVNWREHIVVDPAICHGSACIAGTRVLVTTILDNVAAGLDEGQIVESYPSITRESVRAAMCYAAELAKERTLASPDS